jgi:hypothetical protein
LRVRVYRTKNFKLGDMSKARPHEHKGNDKAVDGIPRKIRSGRD